MYVPFGRGSVHGIGSAAAIGCASDGSYMVIADLQSVSLYSIEPFARISNVLLLSSLPNVSAKSHHYTASANDKEGSIHTSDKKVPNLSSVESKTTPSTLEAFQHQIDHLQGSTVSAFSDTHPSKLTTTVTVGQAAVQDSDANQKSSHLTTHSVLGRPQYIIGSPSSPHRFCVATTKGFILFFEVTDVSQDIQQQGDVGAMPSSILASIESGPTIINGPFHAHSGNSVGQTTIGKPLKHLQFDPASPTPRPLVAHTLTACGVLHDYILCGSKIGIVDFIPWGSASFDPSRTIDLRVLVTVLKTATEPPPSQSGAEHPNRQSATSIYATSISSNTISNYTVILINTGVVYVVSFCDKKTKSVKSTLLWDDLNNPAVQIASNNSFHLIAVGDSTSAVSVFRVESLHPKPSVHLLYTLPHMFGNVPVHPEADFNLQSCLWSPDGRALCCIRRNGSFSLSSVFGSHLADGRCLTFAKQPSCCVWPALGNHLYYISDISLRRSSQFLELDDLHQPLDQHEHSQHQQELPPRLQRLCCLNFLRSSRISTHSLCHEESVVLIGPSSIYLHPDSGADASTRNNVDRLCDMHWQHVQIPQTYRDKNGLIRTAAVDSTGQYVAVAAARGFMHYNTLLGKWKMFGNLNHERQLQCTAGLAWWKSSHIVVAAYSDQRNSDQLQLFSRVENLDIDRAAVTHTMSSKIVALNVLGDLIVFVTSRRRAHILKITPKTSDSSHSYAALHPTYTLEPLLVSDISEHISHLSYMTELALSYVKLDGLTPDLPSSISAQCLIYNASGRLYMRPIEAVVSPESDERYTLGDSILLAVDVEAAWISPMQSTNQSSLLLDALWLGCGRMGLKVWFPLEHSELNASRRVMLTFPLDTSPLALLFREAVVIGATVETCEGRTPGGLEMMTHSVYRKTQLNMHPILQQLLRRGLFRPAKAIADTLIELPYFLHLLELLLHNVLEDEAASPNRDANQWTANSGLLLPTVIEFIQQYDQWLDIVVHCARKTEISKWDYLFECVGSPMASFEACVRTRRLETAASYLMVVQALQDAEVTRRQTIDLLELCLEECMWDLAKDLIRFYEATAESLHDQARNNVHRVLREYAMKLLLDCQWMLLGSLEVSVPFNLQEFLQTLTLKEASISDFATALHCMQSDFPLILASSYKDKERINQLNLDKLRYLRDMSVCLPVPDWSIVFALVLRDVNNLTDVLKAVDPPSQAMRLALRLQTHISTDSRLPRETQAEYLRIVRESAATLPVTDYADILVKDDIEREVNYTNSASDDTGASPNTTPDSQCCIS